MAGQKARADENGESSVLPSEEAFKGTIYFSVRRQGQMTRRLDRINYVHRALLRRLR